MMTGVRNGKIHPHMLMAQWRWNPARICSVFLSSHDNIMVYFKTQFLH